MANNTDNKSLHLESTHFIVPGSYDLSQDNRLLIPFINSGKIGFTNPKGEVIVKPIYDRVNGDVYTRENYVRVGITYSYTFERSRKAPETYIKTKWGLLNYEGKEVLEPNFSSIIVGENTIIVKKPYGPEYNGSHSLLDLQGKIIIPFDVYLRIEPFEGGLFLCSKKNIINNKSIELYGIINESGEVILECKDRQIIQFYDQYRSRNFSFLEELIKSENPSAYSHYFNKNCSIEDCSHSLNELDEKQVKEKHEIEQSAQATIKKEELALSKKQYISALANDEICSEKEYGNVKVIKLKGGKQGVMKLGDFVVPFGKYGWIDGFEKGYARVRTAGKTTNTKHIVGIVDLETGTCIEGQENIDNAVKRDFIEHPESYEKWGIIDENGKEVLPVEYDSVWKFLGKGRNSTKIIKNGIEQEFYFDSGKIDSPCYSSHKVDYGRYFGEYAGSYAQDVAGYSDDVINDAFDGDPDAYWNID